MLDKDEVLNAIRLGDKYYNEGSAGAARETYLALITTLTSENERLQADASKDRESFRIAYNTLYSEADTLRQKVAELEARVPRWNGPEGLPHGDSKVMIVPAGKDLYLLVPLPTTQQETKE